MVETLTGCEPLVVGPGVRTGINVQYDTPTTLGSDRLVDALAARERFGAPVVAVDFGTATTFNVVDQSGDFVGGAIAPGVGLAADALAEAGAQLRRVDVMSPPSSTAVGRNTDDSMRSGILLGYADLVDGLLVRIDAELGQSAGQPTPVVATGGMAPVIAPLVDRITAVDPDLTLDGLRLVAQANGVVT
jgi:type III pantothenate kinase